MREKCSTARQSCFYLAVKTFFLSFEFVFPTLYISWFKVSFYHIFLLLFLYWVCFFSGFFSVSLSVQITRGSNACLNAQAILGRWFKSNTLFLLSLPITHTYTLIQIHTHTHTYIHIFSLSRSLSHTLTYTHSLSLSLSLSLAFSLSLYRPCRNLLK